MKRKDLSRARQRGYSWPRVVFAKGDRSSCWVLQNGFSHQLHLLALTPGASFSCVSPGQVGWGVGVAACCEGSFPTAAELPRVPGNSGAAAASVLAHCGFPSLCFHPLWPGASSESPTTTCSPPGGPEEMFCLHITGEKPVDPCAS